MDALFFRHPGPDGPTPPPWAARVLQAHADGTATIEVVVPGGPPATLVAREGTGEAGTWAPSNRVQTAAMAIRPPEPPAPPPVCRKRASRTTAAPDDPLAGPDRCGLCLRLGCWPGRYCSPTCEARAATPANVDPWSRKRTAYTA